MTARPIQPFSEHSFARLAGPGGTNVPETEASILFSQAIRVLGRAFHRNTQRERASNPG